MGLFDSLFGRKKKRTIKEDDGIEPCTEFIDLPDSPQYRGAEWFGDDPICGFDPFERPFITADGNNLVFLAELTCPRVISDCYSLTPFFEQAAQYDDTFPKQMKISFDDIPCPWMNLVAATPTGRMPKFPIEVVVDVMEPLKIPKSREGWQKAYVLADEIERKRMDAEYREVVFGPKDSIVGKLCYFPDGSIGKADMNFHQGDTMHTVSIRSKDRQLYLAKVSRERISDTKETVLFKV